MKFDDGKRSFVRFKNWFFKGRIKKTLEREKHISILSKEYDDGKIVKIE